MSVLNIDTFFVLKRSLVEVYQLQSCNCKSPTCVKSRRPYYYFRRESREERTETEFETYLEERVEKREQRQNLKHIIC